jgi:hypothetical protein
MSVFNYPNLLGLGSDTGGSIRDVTYCFDDIYGFKPSWGIITRYGMIPHCNELDCVSFLSPSLRFIKNALIMGSRGLKDATVKSRNIFSNNSYYNPRILNIEKCPSLIDYLGGVSHAENCYLFLSGAYAFSNLNRLMHCDYSKSPTLEKFWSSSREESFSLNTRRRMLLGLVYLRSTKIKDIVNQYKEQINLLMHELKKRKIWLYGPLRDSSGVRLEWFLQIANFNGSPSISKGRYCILAHKGEDLLILDKSDGIFKTGTGNSY